jgi:hypothetical protein
MGAQVAAGGRCVKRTVWQVASQLEFRGVAIAWTLLIREPSDCPALPLPSLAPNVHLFLAPRTAMLGAKKQGRTQAMTSIDRSEQRLVVQSGSTTLTLDKAAARVAMQRKTLFWARKPIERPLADIASVQVDANVDRASGVELCSPMLVMRDGSAWALPHTERKDATDTAAAIRAFLGIAA